MQPVNILDILSDTEQWLNWTKPFGPISGFDSKIEKPIERYIITSFCYGCNLGPTQTSRSLEDLNRKQVAWINQRHITEEKLDKAINRVINSYNCFLVIARKISYIKLLRNLEELKEHVFYYNIFNVALFYTNGCRTPIWV